MLFFDSPGGNSWGFGVSSAWPPASKSEIKRTKLAQASIALLLPGLRLRRLSIRKTMRIPPNSIPHRFYNTCAALNLGGSQEIKRCHGYPWCFLVISLSSGILIRKEETWSLVNCPYMIGYSVI